MRYGMMTLLVMVGLSFAFLPYSFRNQSTAFLFEDDYDLIFDPARLPEIEGTRLYTNLSNLTSGDEEVFGPATANYYLFAGSTKLGKLYPGAIYDNYTSKDPQFTGLYDQDSVRLYGDAEQTRVSWQDVDGNGSYDFKSVDSRAARAWEENSETDFLIGFGTRMGENMRLGFGYYRFDNSTKDIIPAFNHLYDRKDSNLVSGLYTFTSYDSAEGLTTDKWSGHEFHLSGWHDGEKASVGLAVKFIPNTEIVEWGNFDTTYTNRSPANPAIIDYRLTTLNDSSLLAHSGYQIPITAKLFYNWNEKTQSRFYLTYAMSNASVTDESEGLTITTADSTCRPGHMTVYDTTYHKYAGERSDNRINLMTQHFFNISERFDLAFGIGFSNSAPVAELIDSSVTYRTTTFNDGDTLPDYDDYTAVTTGSEQWQTMTTGVVRTLYLPIGIEFKLFNPLALRLGATHTITMSDYTTVDNLVAYAPTITNITRGDGTSSETMADQSRKPSTSTEKATTHQTTYTYGLGWSATDNLQIDLMGFAKMTDLTNWKLSVTFKF